jgi:hypothetical protein
LFLYYIFHVKDQIMKRFVLHSALVTVAMATFSLSQPVLTQGILDTGKSILGGGNGGVAAMGDAAGIGRAAGVGGASGIFGAVPLDIIMSLLQKQGYSSITGLGPSPSGDTLQASATNSTGNPVSLLINPTTGGVLSALAK